jgi:drug/metabolite transporter (DMT)-like permease
VWNEVFLREGFRMHDTDGRMSPLRNLGILAAFGAALLFGASTPFAKLLLGSAGPWLVAGLLYLGSGLGLLLYRRMARMPGVHLKGADIGWLAGAILAGGAVGPVLLLFGLSRMPASGAALLLNGEGVFTALLAWFVFRENVDRRVALGMGLIVAGALLLSWPGRARFGSILPSLCVAGACLAWAIDNNLTRKVSLADATFVAMVKGLAAGAVNVALALAMGAKLPGLPVLLGSGLVGFLGYGVSLTLFVVALRHLGAARTGAYFFTAPFAGALLAIPLLGESWTAQILAAAVIMGCGVYLHLTERHAHTHAHEPIEHEHAHVHDAHHAHLHAKPVEGPHTHVHRHDPMTHTHPHFPDAHHQHTHEKKNGA